ncbi:hypothetical protein [Pimelobacter simplex]|uniref:hypothetical protein n=1 Tax=Nocardioides simplex TaxID=2045 RepID=UPI003AB03D67
MTGDEARSLLFLSCDIVGSTRFKQSSTLSLWQKTFLTFYREFPQVLGDLTAEAGFEPEFKLWKPVGDELIFTVHVRNEEDIFHAVRLWIAAMDKYESDVLEDTPLATKGGAFIATFPGPDSESSIPRNPITETSDKGVVELNAEALAARDTDAGDAYMYDYFGPSIDTGFRIFGACDNRYFTLTVEVAWALAQCAADAGVDSEKFPLPHLRFLGTQVFKGVWDGRAYPLFALDRHQSDLINKALAALEDNHLDPNKVAELCRQCSKDADWPSKLYLPASDHSIFRSEPVDPLEQLASNSMDGAETLPAAGAGTGEELEHDPPLPEPLKDSTLDLGPSQAAAQAVQNLLDQRDM